MQNDPKVLLVMIAVSAYVAKLWYDDFRAARNGRPNERALPGAAPAPMRAIIVAALGGFALVAMETWGECKLGLSEQQSTMTALFAVYTLLAAIVEEIIFRGFIVVEKRGRAVLWGSVLLASVAFAALHPFLWKWDGGLPWDGGSLRWTMDAKGWFSTAAVFLASLWFYFVRFWTLNPRHSLLPCFAAHAAKNIGVIAIKASQGFLIGWW